MSVSSVNCNRGKTKKYDSNRKLKGYGRTRKCKTKEKGESGEKGKKTQETSCFSLFPFFHFAFVTQESKPNTMNISTGKCVNSRTL
jgi:hypothetical protein